MTALNDWFRELPARWQEPAHELRQLILDASPIMKEVWRYKTPFFDHRRWMCYLSLQKGELVLGFVQGHLLLDPQGLLEPSTLKQIRHYRPPADGVLPERELRILLEEAVAVNEQVELEKRQGTKGSKSRRRF
ncbi:MAG: DUF1801 domain-containing protein [Flavobacteriales bacterium]|nr:DUF1801 domain-containing protein [Flavobacteriales bacterium]